MDDFRASAPEQRGPANPNVESVPFEDMKERILKIVKGYNGWVLGQRRARVAVIAPPGVHGSAAQRCGAERHHSQDPLYSEGGVEG